MLRGWGRVWSEQWKSTANVTFALGLAVAVFSGACDDDDDPIPMPSTDTGTDPTDSGFEDTGTADSGDTTDPDFARISCDDVTGDCLSFVAGQETGLLNAINALNDDMTIILGKGTFSFDNAVTIRRADGVTFTGQGIDETVLDFSSQATQSNGVDVVGDQFTISHLTITDAKKDALRVETSTNVKIQFVKATWSGGPSVNNGAYGLYPVRCTNVLLEDSEAYNASDAGIYVGQSINVIVRRNVAERNVAGLEIENTQFADVYENRVEDNTAGLVVFDLPGNPVIGRDVKIRNNIIRNNNRANFGQVGTAVASIPAGTGTFALASKRVEIAFNTYANNDTGDIALLSGLASVGTATTWSIPKDQVVGSTVGLTLVEFGDAWLNFQTNEIWVHDNTHSGSGTNPDGASLQDRPIGALLALTYAADGPIDTVLYDGIQETVDPTTPANNTNNNHICVSNQATATFATLDLPNLEVIVANMGTPTTGDIYQVSSPFVPFDCTGFTSGPITDVTLP